MLKWFLSPEGEKLEVKDCLEKGLLSEHYPLSYLKACAEDREWNGKASTTQLLNGLRLSYLKIYTPYAEDPDGNTFRIIGTRAHGKLENLTPRDSFAELSIPDTGVSGIADLLEAQPDGKWWLSDYKVWGSYKVAKALGLQKKQRQMVDEWGNPVLYKRGGKGFRAGDPRKETYYVPDPEKADLYNEKMQLNKYRCDIEKYFDIEIEKMKIFAVVRDGNTHSAKSRGIEKNTYYIDVPFVEYDEIENFYSRRSEQLITHVNSYQSDYVQTNEKNVFDQVDFDLLKKHCPEICSPEECWEGRRCEKYCPVSEVCATIGNPYLENKEAGTCNSVVPGSTTDNKPVIASILKETYSKPPNGRNDAEN